MNKIAMTLALAVTAAAHAQAPIAGQAASSTLKRAQAPEKVQDAKPTPTAAPQEDAAGTAARDAVKMGVVSNVVIVGDAPFAAEEKIDSLLSSLLCDGAEKTVGDLRTALREARQKLVRRGYYLSLVQPSRADAYDMETRSLELLVDPGRFGDVTVSRKETAGGWYSDERILRRFKHVKKDDPFNYFTLRQAARAVNGHPDLQADVALDVRKENGVRYADVDVAVDDTFPFHATLDLNNYAMDELDNWQMLLALQYLNLTGADDVLTVSPGVTMNGDMWSIATSYVRPFDWLLGGSWSVYGGYSDMNTDDVLPRLNLEGTGGFVGFNTSWNLWDTERRNLAFNIGVLWRHIEDEWDVENMHLRSRGVNLVPLTFGFGYADKRRDALGGLDFASVGQTLNLCGDSKNFHDYSEQADAHYLVTRASWSRLQPVYGPSADGEEWRCWSAYGKVEAQYSHNNLVTAERLAYGGNECLRGYRCRGYLGDSGLYGTVEFRTPVWCNPLSDLFRDEPGATALERVQFFVFSDMGGIHYNEVYANMERSEVLWSAGFGVRAALTKHLSLNYEFAVPLERGYAHKEDDRWESYVSVKAQW